jgi:thiamine pyridinylase
VQTLQALDTPQTNLTGDFLGSFNLPSLYLDGYADRHGELPPTALAVPLDASVVDDLKEVFRQCQTGEINPCLNSSHQYDDNSGAAIDFAEERADATFGYSERLHTILTAAKTAKKDSSFFLASAPLSAGRKPVVFVDSFVKRKGCDNACDQAATAFVEYMTQVDTYAWILMSHDALPDARVPRYLLPARTTVFDHADLKADPYYPILRTSITSALPFPNQGLPENRSALRKALLQRVCSTVAADGKSCQ